MLTDFELWRNNLKHTQKKKYLVGDGRKEESRSHRAEGLATSR